MTTSDLNYTVIRSEGEKTVLRWVSKGWRVLPCYHAKSPKVCSCRDGEKCKSPGKHPRVTDWGNVATTDLATIERWFKEFPDANWGIATGKDSNLLVVDIDIKDAGYAAWKTLTDQHEPIPDTFTVQTGSGGKRLYFLFPDDWEPRNTEKKIVKGKGIDTRAEGGFVVVPPSKTDNQYLVMNDTAPVALPAWLNALLRDIAEGRKPAPTPTPEPEPDESESYNEWTWDADLADSLFGGGKYQVELARTSRKPIANKLEEIKFYLSIIPPMEEHEE